jgi:hypothetical protein
MRTSKRRAGIARVVAVVGVGFLAALWQWAAVPAGASTTAASSTPQQVVLPVVPYFPDSPAASFFGNSGPSCPPKPPGAIVTNLTDDIALVKEPSTRTAVVLYPQVAPPPTGGVNVAVESCLLASKSSSLCSTVLDDFGVREFPSTSP